MLCLALLAGPAVAQDEDDKAVQAYVNQMTTQQQKIEAALKDLDKVATVIKRLGDNLEQTYMTASRTIYQEDFDAAASAVEPLVATFDRLNADMVLLVKNAKKDEAAHKKAQDLLKAIEAFEKRYDGGKAVVKAGATAKEWKDKIVNEVRLPRGYDLLLSERDDVDKVAQATKKIGEVMVNLKKSATELVAATEPEEETEG